MTVELSLLQAAYLPVHRLVGASLEQNDDVILSLCELRLAEIIQKVSGSARPTLTTAVRRRTSAILKVRFLKD